MDMQSRPRLLHVLGGGLWQVPTVKLAKELGYRVLVTDMYEDRPAYAFADSYECVDITDLENTLAVATRYGIDGILCDTTDVGVPTAGYVAERMGLPGIGYETALNFTDKHRMRVRTKDATVNSPRFCLTHSFEEALEFAEAIGYPVIVKPPDSQSSRGVQKVNHAAELPHALDSALRSSRQGAALIEQCLGGIEVTVESLCIDGEVYTLGISDKSHFPDCPMVARRLTYPAAFSSSVMSKIAEANSSVIKSLGLETGTTHAEYFVDGEDVALVEIAARGGGSRVYSHIAPYLSGINVPEMMIRFAVGERLNLPKHALSDRAANLEFFSFAPGTIKSITGVEEACRLPGVAEILLEFNVGDVLRSPEDDRSRHGLMLVFGNSRDQVLKTSQAVHDLVKVEVD